MNALLSVLMVFGAGVLVYWAGRPWGGWADEEWYYDRTTGKLRRRRDDDDGR